MDKKMLSALEKDARLTPRELSVMFAREEESVRSEIEACEKDGTILGYRPGKPTADYIKKVLNRITLIGALFLGFIAVFPIVLSMTGNAVFQAFAFGGSSLLIVVGVALETTRDLESQITMRHYKGFLE